MNKVPPDYPSVECCFSVRGASVSAWYIVVFSGLFWNLGISTPRVLIFLKQVTKSSDILHVKLLQPSGVLTENGV